MEIKSVENKNEFKTVDKITRNFILISCVILGSVFLAACAFMITLISNAQDINQQTYNTSSVQNINLVNM